VRTRLSLLEKKKPDRQPEDDEPEGDEEPEEGEAEKKAAPPPPPPPPVKAPEKPDQPMYRFEPEKKSIKQMAREREQRANRRRERLRKLATELAPPPPSTIGFGLRRRPTWRRNA